MATNKLSPQQRANQTQNKKRKGQPTFSSVRFSWENEQALTSINETIARFGKTREQALIAAFEALEQQMQR